jgi:O-antigen ligase
MFTSSDVITSVKKLSHIVIAFVSSYMFYDFFSRDENNIKKILNIVSLVVIFFSFLIVATAIYSLISGFPIYKKIELWFLNPNILGSFLFICSPLLITSGFDFRPVKRLKFLFVLIMLLALFFSFHRSSWLAVLISIGFLLWKGRTKLLLAALIIVSLFVGGLTFPVWKSDLYHSVTGERFSGRREIWKGAWKVACERPVLGTGLGNSGYTYDKYIDTAWLKGQKTHSVYLQNAIEMGFTSVLILFAFYAMLLYCSNRIENNLQSHHLRLGVRGTTATFVGLFVHGIFGNFGIMTSFDAAEFHVLFPYVLMALPFAAKRLEERGKAG